MRMMMMMLLLRRVQDGLGCLKVDCKDFYIRVGWGVAFKSRIGRLLISSLAHGRRLVRS
ncbi:hypothetical protein Hanom_Chr01g00003281 [Helianthus anomalus]